MTDAPAFTTLQFPQRPAWSGIGAENWDGVQGPDDLMLTSGSSVGDALKAEQLERWTLDTTIERLAERLPEFHARWQQDPEEALEWAKQLRFEKALDGTLSATETGTLLHSLWESWLTGVELPETDKATIRNDPVINEMATRMWEVRHRFQPRAVAVEQVVFDPAYGFAGRLDCALTFDKMPELGTRLVDIKTSRESRYKSGGKKRPFGDHALQLSPYFHAPLWATFEPRLRVSSRKSDTRIYLLNPAEAAACAPAPAMDGALILHVTPEAAAFYPIEVGPSVHRRAVEAAGCLRWIKDESKRVIGYPLAPPVDLPTLSS